MLEEERTECKILERHDVKGSISFYTFFFFRNDYETISKFICIYLKLQIKYSYQIY